jgi:prevent-host-death family protein
MNIAEAKAKLSELIARAEAGEEVVIARDGVDAVILKPAKELKSPVRKLGILMHLGPVWETPNAWDPDQDEVDAAEGGASDPLFQK